MATQQNEVKTTLTVDPKDSKEKIGGVAKVIQNVSNTLRGLTQHAMMLGGLGGALGIAKGIQEADQLYQTIGRVKAVTGSAAGEIDAVVDAFGKVGLEASDAESILTRMSKKSMAAAGGMSATAEQAAKMADMFKKMGVYVDDGPDMQILQMAEAVRTGKLQVDGLVKAFGIPLAKAAQMMELLHKGPDDIRDLYNDQKSGAAAVTEASLQQYQRMVHARREAADAWNDTIMIFYRTIFPVVAKVLDILRDKLEKWQPIVEKAGTFLVDHMETVVGLAEKYVKLMVISKGLQAVTGQGVGGLLSGAAGGFAKAVTIGGSGTKLMKAAGGGELGGIAKVLANIGSSFFPKAALFLASTVKFGAVLGWLGKLSAIGVAVAVLVRAFQLVVNNVDGIRDRLTRLLDTIAAQFRGVMGSLTPLLEVLGDGLTYAAKGVLAIIEVIMSAVAALLTMARAFGYLVAMIVEEPTRALHPMELFYDAINMAQQGTEEFLHQKELDDAKARAERAAKPTDATPPGTYQDFRGSKFDIKQSFAEGFDPDKVAVTFGDQLAKLGDRRRQSNLAPLYSVR